MFRTGLAETGEILRNREVAGHADFLATTDAHTVHPADHRLVAADDRGDHVVEQPHISAVLLRIAGIVFGVFLGVAACTKRLVAGASEYHRHHVARCTRSPKRQDRGFYHVGRVGVELALVVERDPGIEQARYRFSISALHRTLLVVDVLGHGFTYCIGHKIVILGFAALGVYDTGSFHGHGMVLTVWERVRRDA